MSNWVEREGQKLTGMGEGKARDKRGMGEGSRETVRQEWMEYSRETVRGECVESLG